MDACVRSPTLALTWGRRAKRGVNPTAKLFGFCQYANHLKL